MVTVTPTAPSASNGFVQSPQPLSAAQETPTPPVEKVDPVDPAIEEVDAKQGATETEDASSALPSLIKPPQWNFTVLDRNSDGALSVGEMLAMAPDLPPADDDQPARPQQAEAPTPTNQPASLGADPRGQFLNAYRSINGD